MRALLCLLAVTLVSSACGGLADPPAAVTLSTGTFTLERIDHAAIPQWIARSGGDSSDVVGATLTLSAVTSRLNFALYSTTPAGFDIVESFSMPFRVIAPDSFTASSWRGRAWKDTAEMLTTGAPFGTHLMRLTRVVGP